MCDGQRDREEEAFNKHIQDTGDGEVDVRWPKGGAPYIVLHDAIGHGIDVWLYRNRGIISVVLVDIDDQSSAGPSGEIELEDLENAIHYLKRN